MKRRQRHYRENDEGDINRRREAIVDRALLYARLLSILDERSTEDYGDEPVAVESDQKANQETDEEQQGSAGPATETSQMLVSGVSTAQCCLRRP